MVHQCAAFYATKSPTVRVGLVLRRGDGCRGIIFIKSGGVSLLLLCLGYVGTKE